MRVLFVNRMMGIAWGGGENYDYHLARAMTALGHDVTFLTAYGPGAKPPTVGLDFQTIAVESPYLRRYMYELGGRVPLVPGAIAQFDIALFCRAALAKLHALGRAGAFDVVQILGLPSLASALIRSGRRVALRFPGPPAWFEKRLLRELTRGPRLALFSHGDTVRLLSAKWGLSVREVPPGVRTDLYQPRCGSLLREQMRQAWDFTQRDFIMTTVGRLVPGKGQEFLLRSLAAAAPAIPSARLLVVGDGPLRGRLERVAGQLGISSRVRFAGQLDRQGVAGALAAADVFCLCSDYENYSNAVLEAMASGLPVVATAVGGFPLQVRDGENGYLVPSGDEAALGRTLSKLAADPVLRRRLSDGAVAFSRQFSWSESARNAIAIYEELLAH